jgi:hypothetical protein
MCRFRADSVLLVCGMSSLCLNLVECFRVVLDEETIDLFQREARSFRIEEVYCQVVSLNVSEDACNDSPAGSAKNVNTMYTMYSFQPMSASPMGPVLTMMKVNVPIRGQ